MEIAVIEKIKSLPQQTEESLRDAFSVLMHTEDRKSVDHYVRWIREEAKKIRTADMYELIKQTHLYAGQYSFDDFMIAMEWNREPQARFWLPLCVETITLSPTGNPPTAHVCGQSFCANPTQEEE